MTAARNLGLPSPRVAVESPQVEGPVVSMGEDLVPSGAKAGTIVAQLSKEARNTTKLADLSDRKPESAALFRGPQYHGSIHARREQQELDWASSWKIVGKGGSFTCRC